MNTERIAREEFGVGDQITCNKIDCLPGKDFCPPLELGKEYPVKEIFVDTEGNQHLDVGLVSTLSYVTSYETGQRLPNGDKIHWCHPSRFTKKPQ